VIKFIPDVGAEIQRFLLKWGKDHYAIFPWRLTDNKFHALLAEVMLQRTKAEQVKPVFEIFSNKYLTAADALKDKKEVLKILMPLGLEWRVNKMIELVHALYLIGGTPPKTLDSLLKLPGVGFYAASAYLTFHANTRALIIDSNSVRLWSRIFGFVATAETRRKRWFLDLVDSITPVKEHRTFNYAVLDYTRALCKKEPLCELCPLNCLCCFFIQKNLN
jgi:A/G-specific adenine glycosylase